MSVREKREVRLAEKLFISRSSFPEDAQHYSIINDTLLSPNIALPELQLLHYIFMNDHEAFVLNDMHFLAQSLIHRRPSLENTRMR